MNHLSSLVRTGLLCLATAAIPFSTGCGMDVGVSGSTGTGGHATTATGGCSNGSTGGSTNTGTGGSPETTSSGSSSGGGAACGGIAGLPCAANEYCDFASDSCGNADQGGTCKPRPMACDEVYSPTCGCDGQIYGNECTANSAGQDIATAGTCTPPPGSFACGAHFCDEKTQYCEEQLSDVGGVPNTYACLALPAACNPSPSCACLAGVQCGVGCSATGGGLKVSCPGG